MITLIIPAFNEAENIERCVIECMKILDGKKHEIIISEDGSDDGTDKIVRELSERYPNIIHMHVRERMGKGAALKKAFGRSKGNPVIFMDADMATSMDHLREIIDYGKRFDVVSGSRHMEGSSVDRPALRHFASKVYSYMAKNFLGFTASDPFCGFKSFSRRFVETEIPDITEDGWSWDIFALSKAFRGGYSFFEFPIDWKERKTERTEISRLFIDAFIHGKALCRIFFEDGISKINRPGTK